MKFLFTANSFSFFKTNGKSWLIVKWVCLVWLVTKLLCYKLWLSDRLFPLVPVHDSLAALPASLHLMLLCLSVFCMALFLFYPNKKIIIFLLLAEILSCLLDQNRWQPWEYQFICMLAAYVLINDENKCRFSWQLIIISLYFFSGLYKCNNNFIHNVWNRLLLRQVLGVSDIGPWLSRAGYLIPFIEMLAALALCFTVTRKPAVWLLIAMHLLNLLLLGPAGAGINSVIWPWNILMPVLLFGIFYNDNLNFINSILWKPVFTWLLLIGWWILPWLQLGGYWDKYLSGVLYSGNKEYLYICTNDTTVRQQLKNSIVPKKKNLPCTDAISVYLWGMMEINTAPYPEARVYKAIVKAWIKRYHNPSDQFYIYRPGYKIEVKSFVVEE